MASGDENVGCGPAFLQQERDHACEGVARFKQTKSLKDRLLEEAQNLREQAKLLAGSVRDATVKKARQAEAAAHMDEWLNSPGCNHRKKTTLRAPISSEAASVGGLFHGRNVDGRN